LEKKRPKKKEPHVEKIVDETILMRRRGAKLGEEVWQTAGGKTVKYNLAYINVRRCGVDNGRVLGYDKSHGYHHRHFMGTTEPIEFRQLQSTRKTLLLGSPGIVGKGR
jgi:hypothetical protein